MFDFLGQFSLIVKVLIFLIVVVIFFAIGRSRFAFAKKMTNKLDRFPYNKLVSLMGNEDDVVAYSNIKKLLEVGKLTSDEIIHLNA